VLAEAEGAEGNGEEREEEVGGGQQLGAGSSWQSASIWRSLAGSF
jgi:hypothetical protein